MNWIKKNWKRIGTFLLAVGAFAGSIFLFKKVKSGKVNTTAGWIGIVLLLLGGVLGVYKSTSPEPSVLAAAITLDAANAGAKSGFGTTLAWNHPVAAGAVLVVTVGSGKDVTGVTFNGAAMTEAVGAVHSGEFFHIFVLGNPDSGTHEVEVTVPNLTEIHGASVSFLGADNSDPIGNTASAAVDNNSGNSYNITIAETGNAIVDGLTQAANYNPDPSPDTGQTQFHNHDGSFIDSDAAYELSETAGTVSVGWTWSGFFGSDTAMAAVEINQGEEAPPAAAPVQSEFWFDSFIPIDKIKKLTINK